MKKGLILITTFILFGCVNSPLYNSIHKKNLIRVKEKKGVDYNFYLPETWDSIPSHGYMLYFPDLKIDKDDNYFKNNFFVLKLSDSTLPIEKRINNIIKKRPGPYTGELIKSYGKYGETYIFKGKSKFYKYPTIHEVYYITFNKVTYVVAYHAIEPLYKKYYPEVKKMFDSFELIETDN